MEVYVIETDLLQEYYKTTPGEFDHASLLTQQVGNHTASQLFK
jgi:hypothetical protein